MGRDPRHPEDEYAAVTSDFLYLLIGFLLGLAVCHAGIL